MGQFESRYLTSYINIKGVKESDIVEKQKPIGKFIKKSEEGHNLIDELQEIKGERGT